jgi:trehalose-phosphatase
VPATTSATFLDESFAAIRQIIAGASPLVLFLDFDGTLAPIRRFPDAVRISSEVRATLELLASRNDTLIAVISGRELKDLQNRVGVPGIVYAAEHGMEIRGRNLSFIEQGALACRPVMKQLAVDLLHGLRDIPGVFIEKKHLTLAVHYRQARLDHIAEIRDRVRAAVELTEPKTELRPGKMVWEVLPRTGWRKAAAAAWIYEALGASEGLPVYAGDDEADEDAFQRLRGWITIRVGNPDQTAAQYTLAGPDEVHQFLTWLTLSRK